MLNAVPAVCGLLMVLKAKLESAAGLTVKALLVPVVLPSVAVMVTLAPDLVTVTETVLVPLEKAPLLVGLIVPAEYVRDGFPPYDVTVLPYVSCAVTTMLNAVPAVCVPIAAKANFDTLAGLTVIPVWEPVIVPVTVSVAVID
jgi:hypothetical protein